ncbi:MAG: 1-deoxy-D-xylulose-5-phosphate reductoisomerase [Gammaproteobacteria bacterium]|nr:1-deoxy-D-xylulose-5-phosphate reductoisomerase [Gammaproteobacteria bacterium]
MRSVAILGATGSIGENSLAVLSRHPDQFRIETLTGSTSADRMALLCREHQPATAVLADAAAANRLQTLLGTHSTTRVLAGTEALVEVATAADTDIVVAGIVGGAGLESTYAAVAAGKTVLLANKEALVMAGRLLLAAAKTSGAHIIPIDSEQNAMHQCMPHSAGGINLEGVQRILLTGSGGPFLHHSEDTLASVTPDQACNHPRWRMGRKISVDSATLMNKGLEYIETSYLFDLSPEQIEVVIHPQSIVHSMVTYLDGSVLAQMATPDMRVPIAYALGFPQRITSGADPLNLLNQEPLTFLPPDETRFPCLALARAALEQGEGHCIALNAANEVAVAAFLARQIQFTAIPQVIAQVLAKTEAAKPNSIDSVLLLDQAARGTAQSCLNQLGI